MVVELLLDLMLQPQYRNGMIVDGFPRTEVQVKVLQILKSYMTELRREFADTEVAALFPRPKFLMVILFIDEEESVRRQVVR